MTTAVTPRITKISWLSLAFACSVVPLTTTDRVVLLAVGLLEANTTKSFWENSSSLLAAVVVVVSIAVERNNAMLCTVDNVVGAVVDDDV